MENEIVKNTQYTRSDLDQFIKDQLMPVAIAAATSVTPFKTYYNRRAIVEPLDHEPVDPISLTIPDQSMSVAQLVYRYTHGMPLGGRTPVYDSEAEIQYPADWDKLDLSEKHDFFQEKAKEYEELQEQLKIRQNAILEKQRTQQIEDEVNRKLEAIRASRKEATQQNELPL